MKSPQVQGKTGYSDLRVMQSGAGYYIGTIFTDEDGVMMPGSRDSGYFPTKEAAEAELKAMESGESTNFRMHP